MIVRRCIGWLWDVLWSRRTEFAAALGCTFASAAFYLLLPIWASRLVDSIVANDDLAALAWLLLWGLAIFTVASLFTFGRIYLMTRLSYRITTDSREKIYHHLLSVSPRAVHGTTGGDLMSSFSNDLQLFQDALASTIAVLIPSIILIVAFTAAMAWHSVLLLLCLVVLVSPLAFVTGYLGRRLHTASQASQDCLARLVGQFDDTLAGAREIKSFGYEPTMAARFDDLNQQTLKVQLLREKLNSFHPAGVALVAAAGIAVMIFMTAYFLDRGMVMPDTLAGFLVLAAMTYAPLQESSHSFGRLVQLSTILDRFQRIYNLPPESSGFRALDSHTARGALQFDSVSFGYQEREFCLDTIDLVIEPGERVAIVGRSGAGKSTLLDLIPRFIVPRSGAILIDGIDIGRIKTSDLRKTVGTVFQETVLFEGSLLENLLLGAPSASRKRVDRAVEAAHLSEFVRELPNGYETRIAARGRNLSVGQRQRIAIARVFLKEPPILLLDEPTSALDADSERLVRDAIERVSIGRTTLIVAHRLTTIRGTSRILVLDRGRIVEDGTHEALIRHNGIYCKLWSEQLVAQGRTCPTSA